MNPEIKQEWIEALRSGDYKQTQEALKDQNGYCCLGVLCDIAVNQGIVQWGEPDVMGCHPIDGEFDHLPEKVVDWVNDKSTQVSGFINGEGRLPYAYPVGETYCQTLIGLNDAGLPFESIADIIEKSL